MRVPFPTVPLRSSRVRGQGGTGRDRFAFARPLEGMRSLAPTARAPLWRVPLRGCVPTLARCRANRFASPRACVRPGQVRYVGVSNETSYGVSEFVRLAQLDSSLPKIVSIQNAYSLLVSRALSCWRCGGTRAKLRLPARSRACSGRCSGAVMTTLVRGCARVARDRTACRTTPTWPRRATTTKWGSWPTRPWPVRWRSAAHSSGARDSARALARERAREGPPLRLRAWVDGCRACARAGGSLSGKYNQATVDPKARFHLFPG